MKINYQLLSIALIICIAMLLMRGTSVVSTQEAVLENIHSRTSIRDYTDQKISRDDLITLVKAGMAAPTARNMQPWSFIIIDDQAKLKEISQIHTHTAPAGRATAAILVTADMKTYTDKPVFSDFWVTDTSIATQNILLAANAMGIGSVWLSVYPYKEKDAALRKIVKIPDDTNILCLVSLGYPAKEVAPKNKWKEEKLSFAEYK